MAALPIVEINAVTHRGHLRAANEDSITIAGWVSDVAMSAPRRSRHTLDEPLLVAVADGMGGHPAGDIASRYAVKRLASEHLRCKTNVGAVLTTINAELYQTMAASSPFLGMGTTVVGLLLTASRALWFNIGDSRLYHFGDRRLVQLSVDDVPRDVRNGAITQSLGGSLSFTPVAPHMSAEDLVVPSRWLLCSDGLTDTVGHAAIEQSMAAGDEDAVRLLFAQAMDAGGADNISIIVASVTSDVD